MRQLISAASVTIFRVRPSAKNYLLAAVVAIVAIASSPNFTSAGVEPVPIHEACAILASVELLSGQELIFKWDNTCGFPIFLKWRSQSDGSDRHLITGTLTIPPHQSGTASCDRCTLPEWTENWHRREAQSLVSVENASS
jgi:hypothetical protein